MSGADICFDHVEFAYGDVRFRFDMSIAAGQKVAIIGPSGSGKTTLLNLLAGFEVPERGRILVAGNDITRLPPHRRPVTMVFQENNLFAHLDVLRNTGLGRSPSLRLSQDDRKAVADALARTGLAGKENRYPAELSGGERQRAALARALVRDRPVLLLDEPLASLGPALRAEMLQLIHRLQGERAMTILMISHQPSDARSIADRIMFIENGTIAVDGSVGDLLGNDPPGPVARYLGGGGR